MYWKNSRETLAALRVAKLSYAMMPIFWRTLAHTMSSAQEKLDVILDFKLRKEMRIVMHSKTPYRIYVYANTFYYLLDRNKSREEIVQLLHSIVYYAHCIVQCISICTQLQSLTHSDKASGTEQMCSNTAIIFLSLYRSMK